MMSKVSIINEFGNLKKVWHFIGLYGWQRTLFKVVGKLRVGKLSWIGRPVRIGEQNIGVIGCGQFAFASIGYFLLANRGRCIASCFDVDKQASNSYASALSVPSVADEACDLIDDPSTKIIYIASNHYSHTEYAVAALAKGKTVYVEKPVSVTLQQLASLSAERRRSSNRIYAGYNRPFSAAIRDLRSWCADLQSPLTLNCFISGHQLSKDHWYREPKEGTRICGNTGHWLDLAVHILSWNELPDRWQIVVVWSDQNNRDDDFTIVLTSERGDLISIILTARTEPFEGVNETINLQWGNTIAKIDDFRRLTVWKCKKNGSYKYEKKDLGHESAIMQPFSDTIRDFSEVEKSTLLMLEIADMVIQGIPSRQFSFADSWAKLGISGEHLEK